MSKKTALTRLLIWISLLFFVVLVGGYLIFQESLSGKGLISTAEPNIKSGPVVDVYKRQALHVLVPLLKIHLTRIHP